MKKSSVCASPKAAYFKLAVYCPDINIEDNYSKMMCLEKKNGFTWGTLNYIMIKVLCIYVEILLSKCTHRMLIGH